MFFKTLKKMKQFSQIFFLKHSCQVFIDIKKYFNAEFSRSKPDLTSWVAELAWNLQLQFLQPSWIATVTTSQIRSRAKHVLRNFSHLILLKGINRAKTRNLNLNSNSSWTGQHVLQGGTCIRVQRWTNSARRLKSHLHLIWFKSNLKGFITGCDQFHAEMQTNGEARACLIGRTKKVLAKFWRWD